MDSYERDGLVRKLHADFLRSVKEATTYSFAWQNRSATLKLQHGNDSHQLHIAKRDDLRLKEYMASYVWHRDNSSFCINAINMLRNEEVNQLVDRQRLPGQRVND